MPWPARLFALARHGAQPAELSGLPVWPAAWALSQHSSEADLTPFPSASAQRLALAMQRRQARPAGPHPLDHCLHQSARALHPVQRLAWLMALVEGHGEKAIEPLLKSLGVALNRPSPFIELGEALAWALGQLGRDILLPIGERFKDAPFLVREHYCQALWYLGGQARGCQAWMKVQQTEWAEAVLYRLEALGSEALIERRRVPIWLDEKSLDRLADLAFSQEPGNRLYALRALDGWGPARTQAVRLVRATLADPDDEVVLQAWRSLLSLGERPDPADVSRALRSQHSQLVELATDHCDLLLGSRSPLDSLEEALEAGDPLRVELALARLLARPFPGERLRRFLALLNRLNDEQQRQAAAWLVKADWWAEDWARLVELEPSNAHLLRAIAERPNATVQLYLQPALRQRLLQRLEGVSGAEELREQLQGACLTWDRLASLSSERRNQALEVILESGELPTPLLQPVLSGESIHPESLELVARMTPPHQLGERLTEIFSVSGVEDRVHFVEILPLLPSQGWPLLSSWLDQPNLAEPALDLLESRLRDFAGASDWLRQEGWTVLVPDAAPPARARWQWLVAQVVCRLDFPDHFEWARELCQADFRSALHALEFLYENYAVSRRPEVIGLILEALGHSDRAVRVEAIAYIRKIQPKVSAVVSWMEALEPDPDPFVQQCFDDFKSEMQRVLEAMPYGGSDIT
ncbi:hypothetical protein ABS71_19765 [bacterium SCN 62-11]|nr:MAG: hypothetical protein ABS71_19765 [bacterium SCN 62-11]